MWSQNGGIAKYLSNVWGREPHLDPRQHLCSLRIVSTSEKRLGGRLGEILGHISCQWLRVSTLYHDFVGGRVVGVRKGRPSSFRAILKPRGRVYGSSQTQGVQVPFDTCQVFLSPECFVCDWELHRIVRGRVVARWSKRNNLNELR